MKIVACSGLRGGTGTSTVAAALAYALQESGKRVLLVDGWQQNMLRLHCGLPFGETAGWARAAQAGTDWRTELFRITDSLLLLPHGEVDLGILGSLKLPAGVGTGAWNDKLDLMAGYCDWCVFDLPARNVESLPQPVLHLQVLEADAAAQALLVHDGYPAACLLVNRYDSASQLQRDLLLLWREVLPRRLAPGVIHRDEAVMEALACKSPVGHHAPDSLAAQEFRALAAWCMARLA